MQYNLFPFSLQVFRDNFGMEILKDSTQIFKPRQLFGLADREPFEVLMFVRQPDGVLVVEQLGKPVDD